MRQPRIIQFSRHEDDRGVLVWGEVRNQLPFTPRRIFYISKVPKHKIRGNHTHRVCEQILVPVSGNFVAKIDGVKFWLTSEFPHGLYVPPLTHIVLEDFSEDAVCLVLCSHVYDAKDYI